MAIKSLSIRIDEEMLDKLHYVADYEGRSANSQINILIRDCIEQYEEKHGKIEIGQKSNSKRKKK
ncbi:Arc family DNA-binding protein [Huintestinicola sp.]